MFSSVQQKPDELQKVEQIKGKKCFVSVDEKHSSAYLSVSQKYITTPGSFSIQGALGILYKTCSPSQAMRTCQGKRYNRVDDKSVDSFS